jgi:hypothetical protein
MQRCLFALGVLMAIIYTSILPYLYDTGEPDLAMGIPVVLQVALAAMVSF